METSELSTSDLVDFKIKLQGQILTPGEDDYDNVRAVWNGMINRTPALIVKCKNVKDVIESVHFARKKNLVISVKGGGHGVAGKAVCNDGLMIDFSQMTSVTVDQANKTVRVEPGVTLGDLDRETAKFGLLTTGGIVSTTGVAGLTLGGGIGYLARKYGLAADNLLSLEIVTADGTLLNCSPTEHQDLFWALRGGGGNFGIVVSFQFQLHTENTDILVAQIFYPMKDAREVLLKYRDLMRTAPDELAGYGLVANIPPVEPFAEELQGTPAFFLLATYAGDHEKGRQLLNPFTEIGEPILAGISAMKYVDLQQSFDAGVPKGQRYYWKHHLIKEISDELIDTFVQYAKNMKGPLSLIGFEPLGGAIARRSKEDTAFVGRDANFALGIWAGWMDAEEDEEIIAWTREFYEQVKPYATGGYYSNYLAQDDDAETQQAYGTNIKRLQKVKTKYDPDNFFHQNFNIKPDQI